MSHQAIGDLSPKLQTTARLIGIGVTVLFGVFLLKKVMKS
jgi:hypothetical protein